MAGVGSWRSLSALARGGMRCEIFGQAVGGGVSLLQKGVDVRVGA